MSSFLVTNVRIFDGESSIERGSVLVREGRIAEVSTEKITYDGPVFDKPGHTLLPGLIDSHIHADSGNVVALPQSLRFGVTTVCDMHNEWNNIEKLGRQIEGGDCADLKTTSFAATIEGGWPAAIVLMSHDTPEVRAEIATWPKLKTSEDGKEYVQARLKEGVDYIKLMHESGTVMSLDLPKPSVALQRSIVEAAHAEGLKVVAHATCLADTLEILSCGVDGLTHTFVDQPPTPELIAAYKRNNAHCNPTLAAMASGTTEGQAIQERFAHDPRVQHLIAQGQRDAMCACMSFARGGSATIENCFETVRQLKAAGVPVIIGSDAAGPAKGTAWGLSVHHELFLFVEHCGFTPEEALRAATALPATRFGFKDRGLIRAGLRADLLLVEGNPLEDIADTLNLRGVWSQGELCSAFRETIWEYVNNAV